MQQSWREFLIQQGATINDHNLVTFSDEINSNELLDTSACVTPCLDYGLIRVSGADAQSFLQGQTSNDVKELSPSRSQLSSYNHPKGRILALFVLHKIGESYVIRMPREILASTLKRLQMFVMRSAVKLEDVSEDYVIIGLAGRGCSKNVSAAGFKVPENQFDTFATESGLVTRLSNREELFELLVEIDHSQAAWNSLCAQAKAVASHTWRLAKIRCGIPEVFQDTVEAFIPQMVNLDWLTGISFTKGCYPGQEIVARMHYLGNLKKRMYLVSFKTSEAMPVSNEKIFEIDSSNTQSVGNLVYCAPASKDEYLGLAVINIKSAESQSLKLGEKELALKVSSLQPES
ncbi:MAG: folate-binding protein [Gammaproteobacteria bacterium]|nr:folate-binding protein [Gammaproteobacteria bacterium]